MRKESTTIQKCNSRLTALGLNVNVNEKVSHTLVNF